MQAKPRPAATPAQALDAMDSLIATAQLGQQEMAERLGLNVTDLLCFACVLKAGRTSSRPVTWPNTPTSRRAR